MADPLEDLESAVERGEGINFVPCIKWVRRGVAKSDPDKVRTFDLMIRRIRFLNLNLILFCYFISISFQVKLSADELAAIIEQTGGALKVIFSSLNIRYSVSHQFSILRLNSLYSQSDI